MDLRGKHAAITGASSGIGEALARELVRSGARVSLVARREDLLASLAKELGGDTFYAKADLCDVERSTEWIAKAEEALGPIDLLVNNAAMQVIGRAWELPQEKIEEQIRLDLMTPLRLTRTVLPGMVARGEGAIVDVASMAAIAPPRFMTGYNAAKAGLAAASESLRGELLGTGVHVVTVYPGPVDTPLSRAGYSSYESTMSVRSIPEGSPATLARLIRRAIEKKQARVIYPRFYALSRWLPNTTRFFLDHLGPNPRTLKSGTEA
jgi:short-subunit dehydrogenase